jgi:hypothetical protein
MSDDETGIVKSITHLDDDEGRTVLRAIIDFYDGNCPMLTFNSIWEQTPVKIVEVGRDPVAQVSSNEKHP